MPKYGHIILELEKRKKKAETSYMPPAYKEELMKALDVVIEAESGIFRSLETPYNKIHPDRHKKNKPTKVTILKILKEQGPQLHKDLVEKVKIMFKEELHSDLEDVRHITSGVNVTCCWLQKHELIMKDKEDRWVFLRDKKVK